MNYPPKYQIFSTIFVGTAITANNLLREFASKSSVAGENYEDTLANFAEDDFEEILDHLFELVYTANQDYEEVESIPSQQPKLDQMDYQTNLINEVMTGLNNIEVIYIKLMRSLKGREVRNICRGILEQVFKYQKLVKVFFLKFFFFPPILFLFRSFFLFFFFGSRFSSSKLPTPSQDTLLAPNASTTSRLLKNKEYIDSVRSAFGWEGPYTHSIPLPPQMKEESAPDPASPPSPREARFEVDMKMLQQETVEGITTTPDMAEVTIRIPFTSRRIFPIANPQRQAPRATATTDTHSTTTTTTTQSAPPPSVRTSSRSRQQPEYFGVVPDFKFK